MPITAQSADGVQHQFPDGTDPSVIDKVMKAYASQQPGPQRTILPEEPSEDIGSRNLLLPLVTRLGQKRRIERGPADPLSFGAPSILTDTLESASLPGKVLSGERTVESISPQESLGFAGLGVGGSVVGKSGLAGEGVFRPRMPMPRSIGRTTEAIRSDALTRARGGAAEEESAAALHAKEAGAAQRGLQSIEAGQPIREARAAQAAPVPFEAERQRVLAELRDRVQTLRQSYLESGMNVGQANRQVALTQRQVQEAEAAVTQLDQELLSRPTMTQDEFGARVRQLTQSLHDKYTEIRKVQSGFTQAVEGGGSTPIVNTAPTQALIDQHLKDVRNPTLQGVLGDIKDMLATKTTGKSPTDATATVTTSIPRLSVKAADSLRGYLDSILRSKMAGDRKIDRETLYVVRQIKKALVEAATQASPAYRQALGKWSTLSRPLNIIERKGGLRPIIDTDPVSSDFRLTQAQVVGKLVTGARAGQPVIARLIEENPEFKDAARLYFTQDLFVRGEVPSPASLKTWLKNNERPLRQAGLYDEFKDIRRVKETAQRAVDEAKGAMKGSAQQVRAAEEAERGALADLKRAESLRDKQARRIAEAKALDKAGPDARVISSKRVETAKKTLEQKAKEAQTAGERRKQMADRFRQYETELKTARPEDVPKRALSFFKTLREDGRIGDAQYERLINKVQEIDRMKASREKKIKLLMRLGRTVAAVGLGWEAYRAYRDITGY